MLSLLVLYTWTLLAGCIAAPTLSVLGVQLATRDRAMQTLCVGQGAMVGVLFGMGFFHPYEGTWFWQVGPFCLAVLMSAFTIFLTDKLVSKRVASKNTFFALVFGLLLAVSSLVTALFPALESHMAQVYFGDLATLPEFDSKLTMAVSGFCLMLLIALTKSISNESFESAIFGEASKRGRRPLSSWAFRAITLVILSLSVQFLGFLFTIVMLFIPSAMMNYLKQKGLRLHVSLCIGLSVTSTVAGFLLSLTFTRLPTVPTISALMFVVGLGIVTVESVVSRWRRFKGVEVRERELAQT